MAMLIMEAIGPRGEELALAAGKSAEIPVGWDEEFDSATFDADGLDEAELDGAVFDALAGIDPAWREHLKVVD